MSTSEDRPPARDASQYLLDAFADLRERLVKHTSKGDIDSDWIKRYDYFIKNSNVGRQCPFAQKSKLLFYKDDFRDIKKLIEEVSECIKKFEEENE